MALPDLVGPSSAWSAARLWAGLLVFPVLIVLTCLCGLVPFSPYMPMAGLDPSWVFGMNQAIAQGLVLGRDIVFTYGPYAAVATKSYHPATDGLMIWGALCFALSFALALLLHLRNSHWIIKALMVLALAFLPVNFDAVVFSHAFLAGLYVLGRDVEERPGQLRTIGCLLVLLLPFGLAPLVKGSFILSYAAVAALSCLYLLSRRNWTGAAMLAALPLIYMVLFWVAADQRIENIPVYFTSLIPIIAGYTDAMLTSGPLNETFVSLITVSIFVYVILISSEKTKINKYTQIAIFLSAFLMAWKAGYVRQDGHTVITGMFMVYTGIVIFNSSYKHKEIKFSAGFIFLILLNIVLPLANHHPEVIRFMNPLVFNQINNASRGLNNRLADNTQMEGAFIRTTGEIATAAALPVLPGTSDIYSYGQSALIASGNQWNPRPVFQSYSAYTPALAEMNNAHLSGEGAPDNLFFAVQPIDGRFPALEDGLSWPTILQNYRPAGFAGEYLILKKQSASPVVLPQPPIKAQHALGEIVAVPPGSGPMFARIKFRKSIVGKIADLALKSAKLRLWVMLDDGTVSQYRLIAGMTETGFLISPLVGSAADFAQLYSNPGALDGKRVRSLSIVSFGLPGAFREEYEIAFLPLSSPRAP